MKQEIEYCGVTEKYCYSSEAKATRAINRYEEIVRCYFCTYCFSWHTTSREDINAQDEQVEQVSIDDVSSRLKQLRKKIEKSKNKRLNRRGYTSGKSNKKPNV